MIADLVRTVVICCASLVAGLTGYIALAAVRYRRPFRNRPIYPLCLMLALANVYIVLTLGFRMGEPLTWRSPFALVIAAGSLATLLLTALERHRHFRASGRIAEKWIRERQGGSQ